MSPRRAALVVAAAAALPRLAVLVEQRGRVLSAYTEKSDRFATTFIHHGTYGFVPGEPSAYTQPLYGWFLIPVYWLFGRNWVAFGLAQLALAVATALLVLAIGRRFLSPGAAATAAVVATLNPYLVWHDMHVNREIVDQVAAAALVLVTLLAAERRSLRLAAVTGAVSGIAILGNTRLALLPVVLAVYLAWHVREPRRAVVVAALVLGLAAIAVAPWVVRNRVEVGCWTLTTDARALWKANNPSTYRILASGGWIDTVPPLPGAPAYTPEAAGDFYLHTGRVLHVDECAQMHLYERRVLDFWRRHPGEKAKLAGLAVRLLWDPRASETSQRPGQGTHLYAIRRWGEGVWISALYALGIVGLFAVPRAVAALILLLLAYQTLAAAVFAGTTRYRVAWDFLIALAAATALAWVAERRRARTEHTQLASG